MGTHYAIYAEVRVGNKWYNLNPLFQRADGKIDVCPVISGRNWLRETYEEMEEGSSFAKKHIPFQQIESGYFETEEQTLGEMKLT